MDLSKIEFTDKEFHDSIYCRCDPKLGDVLLTKDGVNTGNVTINTLSEEFSLLSSVCLIRPKENILNAKFIKYYIQSPEGFRGLTGQMTGTAIKRIILAKIKTAIIPLASIEEQTQIVQEIETRLSVCDKLNESIDQSLEKAQALRQSILKKAFEGKLLSQDELQTCRQQPDWEPAAKLLERVKNQKSK